MKLENKAGLTEPEIASIEREVSAHSTLQQVLDWAMTRAPHRLSAPVISAVVVQDEYTHDVVVPLSEDLVLVYGTT